LSQIPVITDEPGTNNYDINVFSHLTSLNNPRSNHFVEDAQFSCNSLDNDTTLV